MSVRREKMLMIVFRSLRWSSWFGSAQERAEEQAGSEEHPGFGRTGTQIVQQALAGAAAGTAVPVGVTVARIFGHSDLPIGSIEASSLNIATAVPNPEQTLSNCFHCVSSFILKIALKHIS